MAEFLQTFKGTSIIRTVLLLLVSIFSLQATRAQDFVTDVMVIGGSKSETQSLRSSLQAQGWVFVDKDLNAGAGGDYIYLLYKKASVFTTESFVTDFYIKSGSGAPNTIEDECGVTYYLTPYDGGSHFKEQKGDLNSNTGANTASIHLYYTKQYINTFSVWKLWDTLRDPETKKYFGFKIDDVTMAMDLVIGRSMAEELPFIPGYDYNKMLDPNFSVEEYMEEHKKFKDIPIKDYPKVFPELFEQGKQWKK